MCVKFTDITIDLEFYLDDYATEKDEDILSTVVMYVESDFDVGFSEDAVREGLS